MISYEPNPKIQKPIQESIQDQLKTFVERNELCRRYLKENIKLTLTSTEKPNILDVEVKMPCKGRVRPRVLPYLCNFC